MVIIDYSIHTVDVYVERYMHMKGQGSLFLYLIVTHGQGRSAIGANGLGEKC